MIIAVFAISVAFLHGKVRKVILCGATEGLSQERENLEVAQESLFNS